MHLAEGNLLSVSVSKEEDNQSNAPWTILKFPTQQSWDLDEVSSLFDSGDSTYVLTLLHTTCAFGSSKNCEEHS